MKMTQVLSAALVLLTQSMAYGRSLDVIGYSHLMSEVVGTSGHIQKMGVLQITETANGQTVSLSEENAKINGRACSVTYARFQGSSLNLQTMKRENDLYMSVNVILKHELAEGDNFHLAEQKDGKAFGEYHGLSAVTLNEHDGVDVPTIYSSLLSLEMNKKAHTDRYRVMITNAYDLDWGPKSLLVKGNLLFNGNTPQSAKVSLVVAEEIRNNPPANYTLPNDIHLECKF